jgi:hypothetical protein
MTDSKKTPLDILSDDAFWDRVGDKAVAHREAELAERRAFLQSPTCQRMVEILLGAGANRQFDSESYAYNPDHTRGRMGWDEFDNESVRCFIRAVGDARLETIVDRREVDGATTFTHMGVDVTVASGQGTVYMFSNASVILKRKIESGELPLPVTAEELQRKLKLAAAKENIPTEAELIELRNAINLFLGRGVTSLFTYSIPSQFATEGTMPTVALAMEGMTLRDVL